MDGDGTALDPFVWSAGALPERFRLAHAVRDRPVLLAGIWDGEWIAIAAAPVTTDDVGIGPYSVGILVKWVAFLGSPAAGTDLAVGGVSFVEVLILYELWAGERLVLEKAIPWYRRPGRPLSASAVPFGPGTDIWRSCRFIGAFFRVLCLAVLVGFCLATLVLIAAGFDTLVGEVWSWSHFQAERVRLAGFLNELLLLFRYPPGSAASLLEGTRWSRC